MQERKLVEELSESNSRLHLLLREKNWQEFNDRMFAEELQMVERELESEKNILWVSQTLLRKDLGENPLNAKDLASEIEKTLKIINRNIELERKKGLRTDFSIVSVHERPGNTELYSAMQNSLLQLSKKTGFFIERLSLHLAKQNASPVQKSAAKNILELLERKENEIQGRKQRGIKPCSNSGS